MLQNKSKVNRVYIEVGRVDPYLLALSAILPLTFIKARY
jgi:hypothetical protein